ncbi:hypothetical protein KUA24_2 [Vibrio phage HNL01]|nr:hypothetical protein KUA24_2 [Vibrio phage HNL01]
MMIVNKDWKAYCKVLGVNPYAVGVRTNEFYMKGFEEWKKLQSEYKYHSYMSRNT